MFHDEWAKRITFGTFWFKHKSSLSWFLAKGTNICRRVEQNLYFVTEPAIVAEIFGLFYFWKVPDTPEQYRQTNKDIVLYGIWHRAVLLACSFSYFLRIYLHLYYHYNECCYSSWCWTCRLFDQWLTVPQTALWLQFCCLDGNRLSWKGVTSFERQKHYKFCIFILDFKSF